MTEAIHDFWQKEACGERYAHGASLRERLEEQARMRYALEPCIWEFARFEEGRDKDVLEIGVGMGADHAEWAGARPRSLVGIDLTERAVEYTKARIGATNFSSRLLVGDAEHLPFEEDSFDIVYSWGVLHVPPGTEQAVAEVLRVLRPGGIARIMIYHRYSFVGLMLYLRYGLLAGHPGRPIDDIYACHLESPGTRVFSVSEAYQMFSGFSRVSAHTELSPGDVLEGGVGQQHRGALLTVARRLWPRWLVRRAFPSFGLYLLIEAYK